MSIENIELKPYSVHIEAQKFGGKYLPYHQNFWACSAQDALCMAKVYWEYRLASEDFYKYFIRELASGHFEEDQKERAAQEQSKPEEVREPRKKKKYLEVVK